ncbi:hypothetical protein ColTof3_01555 [Colletotrichum tofieldiae]|nr:hypothetical protein ColTof3_01555 [Colletotrichum tofieldiae]GKT95917.1 hypothetical protein Ct61P_13767 [Colletotrichum tofieldiae]
MCLLDTEYAVQTAGSVATGAIRHPSMGFQTISQSKRNPLQFIRRLAPLALLVFGIWAISYPDEKAGRALGFEFASKLTDSVDFWQSIGALAVVWATGRLRLLKRTLTSGWMQYMGAISYSLYLVHYPLLEMLGWRLTQLLREYFSNAAVQLRIAPTLGVFIGNLFAFFTVTFALLWTSDYTWRALDKPCLRMIRWLEDIL